MSMDDRPDLRRVNFDNDARPAKALDAFTSWLEGYIDGGGDDVSAVLTKLREFRPGNIGRFVG